MNLDFKSENNCLKQSVSFEEIICEVQAFNYIIDNTTTDKEQTESKNKRTKNLGQIRNEAISKLLEIIIKLDTSVETERNTRETKIKSLFHILRDKLGDDLYLFNVRIVAYYLQGFERIEDIKLNSSIKCLFDVLLIDIESQLNELIPLKSETNLFFDEDKLKELLHFYRFQNTDSRPSQDNIFALSKLYVYLVLKNFMHHDFYNQLFKVDLSFAEHIAEFEPKQKNKYLLRLLSDMLLDANPRSKARSFVHLYFTNRILDLASEVDILTLKLGELRNTNFALTYQVKQQAEEGHNKDITIHQLTEEVQDKDSIIVKLESELKVLGDRFDYEINRADRQNQDLRSHIISRLKNDLLIELNDLIEFANGLPISESDILKMYVNNIKQTLNNL
jgi:hypothetical protein